MTSKPRSGLEEHPLLTGHPFVWRMAFVLWTVGLSLFLAMAIPATSVVVRSHM